MTDTLREHLQRIAKLPRKPFSEAEKELRRTRMAEARKKIKRVPKK